MFYYEVIGTENKKKTGVWHPMIKTPTSEAKEIIVNLLKNKPGEVYTISQIKDEIHLKSKQKMTEGTVSGAIHALTKDRKSGVVNLSRGVYSYDSNAIQKDNDITHLVYNGVFEYKEKLKDVVSDIDIFLLDEKDIPILQGLKKLITDSEKFNEKLIETYGKNINKQ